MRLTALRVGPEKTRLCAVLAELDPLLREAFLLKYGRDELRGMSADRGWLSALKMRVTVVRSLRHFGAHPG